MDGQRRFHVAEGPLLYGPPGLALLLYFEIPEYSPITGEDSLVGQSLDAGRTRPSFR